MRLRGTITLLGTVTHTQLRATRGPTRLTAGWAIALFCVLCVLRCLLPEGEGTGGNSCDSSPFPVFACRPPFFFMGGGRRYGPRGSQPIRSETPTDRPVAQMPASHSATDFDRFYFFVFLMIVVVVVLFFLLLALHRRNPEEVSASLEKKKLLSHNLTQRQHLWKCWECWSLMLFQRPSSILIVCYFPLF